MPKKPKPVVPETPSKPLSEFQKGAFWALELMQFNMVRKYNELERLAWDMGPDIGGIIHSSANMISGLKIKIESEFAKNIREADIANIQSVVPPQP